MHYFPGLPLRKRLRLKGYDCSRPGYYLITICTKKRINYFGEITEESIVLNVLGRRAEMHWREIPDHFPEIELDEYVIMPDHIHGLLRIVSTISKIPRAKTPFNGSKSTGISSAIKGFKYAVTRYCRNLGYQDFAWQSSFYDSIIKNELDLPRIRNYIRNNPRNGSRQRKY